MSADLATAAKGDVVASRTIHLTRDALVRYAAASGDFNPIHYRDDIASEAGLPGVLAQGMLTMGAAVSVLEDALDDPARILSVQARFAKPVVVDPDLGVDLRVEAVVGEAQGDDGVGRIDLAVHFVDTDRLGSVDRPSTRAVLSKAQARVRFAAGSA